MPSAPSPDNAAPMQPVAAIPTPPTRPVDGHKGTFGTVVVVGGSVAMPGAAALCARAAIRSGAGLVKLATPAAVVPTAITIEPGATAIVLHGDAAEALEAIDQADPDRRAVLAIGPGLGRAPHTAQLVVALLMRSDRATVLDADGLNLLAMSGKPLPELRREPADIGSDLSVIAGQAAAGEPKPVVLTPHPGEFRRLADAVGIDASLDSDGQRADEAAKLARAHGAVVLLKGHRSIITDGQRLAINETGNPAMAVAGSGDVLTGCIAALMAQGMQAFDAAVLGAHVHGAAGDRWAAEHGPAGLRAMELADGLPRAVHALRTPRSGSV